MSNSYRTENGNIYKIVTTMKKGEPVDRLASRERARAVERKTRSQRNHPDGYFRHAHQIHMGWEASNRRKQGKRATRRALTIVWMAFVLIVLVLAYTYIFSAL